MRSGSLTFVRGIVTTLLASNEVPQENRLGFAAGERIAELVTGAGVRLVGDVKVSAVQKNIVRWTASPLPRI